MRYIDADALLQRLPDDLPYKGSVKRVLIQAPTADVVPKSEVAKIFEEIEKAFTVKYSMCTNPVLVLDSLSFAELKKKYIGDEK